MREPPRLSEAALRATVADAYGISIRALTFLPLGADADSAAYRVQANDGEVYFLKARALPGFRPASLLVPQYLHGQGIPHLLAPLSTRDGAAWVLLDGFALSLYPFVEGRMVADAGLSERQWTELGATLQQIHASRLPPDLLPSVPRENFVPSRREVLEPLQAAIESHASTDPVQIELAGFWLERGEAIRALVMRSDALARQLRPAASELVLCHADLHTWNILLDPHAQLWLVDWDETILALKERDLMFVIGGIGPGLVSPRETACFLQGYGAADIDPLALTYYRYAWAVQDMAAYGEQVFFAPGLSEASRRDALAGFLSLFTPGNIVDIAFGSEDSLP